jgi:GntR family transcriptional regulator, transcriptional repressor for pyruvate dehydrogenase complex
MGTGQVEKGAPDVTTPEVAALGVRIGVHPIRLAFQQVADQLRELVVHGDLAPGTRLPSEPELAAQFGVSRSTIREALRMLSSQHLITTSRGVGGGSYVTHPEPEEISRLLHTNIGLLTGTKQVGVQELLEAREVLEVPAARLAALRHTDAHVEALQAALPDTISDMPEERTFQVNAAFHKAILDAAGNELLRLVTSPIFTFLQTRFLRNRATPQFWDQVWEDHGAILEAIAAGDPERAAAEMLRHLENLRPNYEQIDRATTE